MRRASGNPPKKRLLNYLWHLGQAYLDGTPSKDRKWSPKWDFPQPTAEAEVAPLPTEEREDHPLVVSLGEPPPHLNVF